MALTQRWTHHTGKSSITNLHRHLPPGARAALWSHVCPSASSSEMGGPPRELASSSKNSEHTETEGPKTTEFWVYLGVGLEISGTLYKIVYLRICPWFWILNYSIPRFSVNQKKKQMKSHVNHPLTGKGTKLVGIVSYILPPIVMTHK